MILVRASRRAVIAGRTVRTTGHSPWETTMATLQKGTRITGTQRTKLAAELKRAYKKGASIRELAQTYGRSYGFVHRVLSEADVTLRGRGGATRGNRKSK